MVGQTQKLIHKIGITCMELEYDRGENLSLYTTLLYLVYLILFTYSDIV